ncbi:hypothetical protein EMCRGX_G032545 [Ephydatia muelleri]
MARFTRSCYKELFTAHTPASSNKAQQYCRLTAAMNYLKLFLPLLFAFAIISFLSLSGIIVISVLNTYGNRVTSNQTNATAYPTVETNATAYPTNATANATAYPTNATANATAYPTNATAYPTNATAYPTNATAYPTNATAYPTVGAWDLDLNIHQAFVSVISGSVPLRVYSLEFMDEVVRVEAHDSDVLSIEYSPLFEGETTTT